MYEKIKKKPLTILRTDNVEEMKLVEETLNITLPEGEKEFLVDLDKFT